jgi:glycosyltransferase involved in cell wall biosynthesis
MARVYAALDVVVLPSLYEGMPVVILEALAAKKAVIATRVGAVPEILVDDVSGLLIEPDDTHALANALRRAITDADLRQALGENGNALVRDHFSAAGMARKYLDVYESAMQDHAAV